MQLGPARLSRILAEERHDAAVRREGRPLDQEARREQSLIGAVSAHDANMEAAAPVWNAAALKIVTAEFVFILVCLAITYWLQSRKRDFL